MVPDPVQDVVADGGWWRAVCTCAWRSRRWPTVALAEARAAEHDDAHFGIPMPPARELWDGRPLPDPGPDPDPDPDPDDPVPDPDGYVPGDGPQPEFIGPLGRWPDDTPEYDTAATTVIANMGQLASALASAQPGDVIEVENPGGTYRQNIGGRAGPLVGPAGDTNVLVRPTLGQRGSATLNADSDHEFHVRNVTLAGFKVGNARWRCDGSERLHLAWWELAPNTNFNWNGSDRCSMIEHVRQEHSLSQGSQMVVWSTNSAGASSTNVTMVGCWLMCPGGNKDNIQTLGGNSQNLTIAHNVLFTGWDKVFQMNYRANGIRWANNWSECCATTARPSSMFETGSGTRDCIGGISNAVQVFCRQGTYEDNINLGGFGIIHQNEGTSQAVFRRNWMYQNPNNTGGNPITLIDNDIDPTRNAVNTPPPRSTFNAADGMYYFTGDLDAIWHP